MKDESIFIVTLLKREDYHNHSFYAFHSLDKAYEFADKLYDELSKEYIYDENYYYPSNKEEKKVNDTYFLLSNHCVQYECIINMYSAKEVVINKRDGKEFIIGWYSVFSESKDDIDLNFSKSFTDEYNGVLDSYKNKIGEISEWGEWKSSSETKGGWYGDLFNMYVVCNGEWDYAWIGVSISFFDEKVEDVQDKGWDKPKVYLYAFNPYDSYGELNCLINVNNKDYLKKRYVISWVNNEPNEDVYVGIAELEYFSTYDNKEEIANLFVGDSLLMDKENIVITRII